MLSVLKRAGTPTLGLEEKHIIAGLYLNRLKKDMPLQACPTIKFAWKRFDLKRLYDRLLSIDSPYNTYRIKGLPPGAIGNAGLDAILATVYPAPQLDEDEKEIDAYYFVSNNAGKTYYANSLAKHEKNKEQVRKENEAAAAAAAGETDEQ